MLYTCNLNNPVHQQYLKKLSIKKNEKIVWSQTKICLYCESQYILLIL